MLRFVRDVIRQGLGHELPDVAAYQLPSYHGGLYVTLSHAGALRGMVGTFFSAPLAENLSGMALAAAYNEPRFRRMNPTELEACTVEITLVATPRAIVAEALDPTRHGVILTVGENSGLLLPHIAREHGWDREAYLGYACRKAGLPMDAWRAPECSIEAFETVSVC